MTDKPLALILLSVVVLAACGVNVEKNADGSAAKVNVASPFGSVSVKTDIDGAETGLPVYPGAHPRKKGDRESSSADVIVGSSFFGVRVIAAEYESGDPAAPIVDFYQREMRRYGSVTECRGAMDIDGGPGDDTPTCRERSGRVDLAVGTKSNHRVVSVKSRGTGSVIDLVHIQTGN
jgi:hypothetical protein